MKGKTTRRLYGSSYQLLLLAALVIVVSLFSLNTPFFFRWDNLRNILDQSTLNIIMAVGMTFVIGSSGIDLSVGASAALSGVICAILMKSGTMVYIGRTWDDMMRA
jgi:ribose transport system permease protein